MGTYRGEHHTLKESQFNHFFEIGLYARTLREEVMVQPSLTYPNPFDYMTPFPQISEN